MKRILITGENSYIGNSVYNYLDQADLVLEKISLRGENWKSRDFTNVDVLLHAVGIAHIKETNKNQELYYKINRDLAYEVAQKAKREGVKHFILLSSLSVYGIEKGIINGSTIPNPNSAYGKSKLESDDLISKLSSEEFIVTIIRPPMVYGYNCKGNYLRLSKLAMILPFFPDFNNQRSMIHIDNLCEFIKLLIEDRKKGVFLPQNSDFVSTNELVKVICEVNEKKINMTKLFNCIIKKLNLSLINKLFGDLVIDKEASKYSSNYNIINFHDSILKSEKGEL